MRILALTDFYEPVVGGLERFVGTVSRNLVARDHDVVIATLARPGQPAYVEREDGVRVYRISGLSRALGPLYENPDRPFHPTIADPGISAALQRIMRRERPAVVQAHSWMLHSFLPIKRLHDAPLVVYLHDYGLACAKKTFVHRGRDCSGPAYGKCVRCASAALGRAKGIGLTSGIFASSRLYDRVDRFLANSRAVARANMTAPHRPPEFVEVVPSFIPDEAPRQVHGARPPFLPAEDGYVMFVGALGEHKGFPVLLDAVRGLPDVPVLAVGTSQFAPPGDLPSNVTVVQDAPHDQVMAAWGRAAIGVVPSVWPEPFGQVAVEAMAAGRPVVASAVGGLQDVVLDGVTGLLVPPGDVGALRAAIARLRDDPDLRERLGAEGRRRASEFLAHRTVTRLAEVYREVVSGLPPAEHAVLIRRG